MSRIKVFPIATSLVAVFALFAALHAAPAPAAIGDLTYLGCITADDDVGPGGSAACEESGTTAPMGTGTGLDLPRALEVSRDGRHAYATGADDAVVVLSRSPQTGLLSFNSCLTGDSGLAACEKSPTATPGGDDSGLGNLGALAIGPDDRSLYVVSQDDYAITRLQRNTQTGVLSFGECISGRGTTASTCAQSPTATGQGGSSGFQDLESIAISPDGSSLFAASSTDDTVVRLGLNGAGALSWGGCISADTSVGSCGQVPGASFSGAGSGLDGASWVEVSPDGRHVYALGPSDDAITRFTRDQQSGSIIHAGCISAETQSSTFCEQFPVAVSAGSNTGFDRPTAIALSPDGGGAYVSSRDDDSVATLARNPTTGALSWLDCISGETESAGCVQSPDAFPGGANSGLDRLLSVRASIDGRSVYAAAHFDAGVVSFDRNLLDGSLSYRGCISGETEPDSCTQIPSAKATGVHSGLDGAVALALTRDGRGLLVAADEDDSIAAFSREPAPACSDGLDNDSDGRIDHPADPGCSGPADNDEADPPPPLDTTAPNLRLSGKKKQRSHKRIVARAVVNEDARVRVRQKGKKVRVKGRRASAAGKRKLKFKPLTKNIKADGAKKFKLKPKGKRNRRKLKKLLRRGSRVTVKLRGTATDDAGNKGRDGLRVKLKR